MKKGELERLGQLQALLPAYQHTLCSQLQARLLTFITPVVPRLQGYVAQVVFVVTGQDPDLSGRELAAALEQQQRALRLLMCESGISVRPGGSWHLVVHAWYIEIMEAGPACLRAGSQPCLLSVRKLIKLRPALSL